MTFMDVSAVWLTASDNTHLCGWRFESINNITVHFLRKYFFKNYWKISKKCFSLPILVSGSLKKSLHSNYRREKARIFIKRELSNISLRLNSSMTLDLKKNTLGTILWFSSSRSVYSRSRRWSFSLWGLKRSWWFPDFRSFYLFTCLYQLQTGNIFWPSSWSQSWWSCLWWLSESN